MLKYFNPLAPRRSETPAGHRAPSPGKNFNPLAPRRSETITGPEASLQCQPFQPTRSAQERDVLSAPGKGVHSDFNPLAPCRSETKILFGGLIFAIISTHSLRAGARRLQWELGVAPRKFQPTRSVQERDPRTLGRRALYDNFNPLAPCRSETRAILLGNPLHKLISTHSLRAGARQQTPTKK